MNQPQYDLGKLPPQAVDLEEAVLGAILNVASSIEEICDIIRPESFYKESNQKIYNACLKLFANNEPIDILTVTEQLRKTEEIEQVGGPLNITMLSTKVSSSAHIVYHAQIVQQKYIQRELIRSSAEITTAAYDDSIDVKDVLDFAETQIFKIQESSIKKEIQKISDVGMSELTKIEQISKSDSQFTGLPSGFTELDRVTSGWQNGDLIILAGRPSMGKTAFVLQLAINMALDFKKKIGFFSLEMGIEQLWMRTIASITDIENGRLRNGRLNENDDWILVENAQRKLEMCDIYVDDTPGLNIMELRAKARRLKSKKDIDIVVIDYLQLLSGSKDKGMNREQEISSMSRSLKIMAKELNIPVICLSQLNRSVEIRSGDKRPQLSDLRESGAIEQDADIVGFIHRPEYYGLMEYMGGESTKNVVEILIKKHRNGSLADIKLYRTENFTRIHEEEQKIKEINNNDDIQYNTDFGQNPKQLEL